MPNGYIVDVAKVMTTIYYLNLNYLMAYLTDTTVSEEYDSVAQPDDAALLQTKDIHHIRRRT